MRIWLDPSWGFGKHLALRQYVLGCAARETTLQPWLLDGLQFCSLYRPSYEASSNHCATVGYITDAVGAALIECYPAAPLRSCVVFNIPIKRLQSVEIVQIHCKGNLAFRYTQSTSGQ